MADQLPRLAFVGAATFPLGAVLQYYSPISYVGLALLLVSLLLLVVVMASLHLRARSYYGKKRTLFGLTVAGLVLLPLFPLSAFGAVLLLIAGVWFLVRLVRQTPLVDRSDVAPLAIGVVGATVLGYVLDITDLDAEPAFVLIFAGMGGTLFRLGRALDSAPNPKSS